MNRREAARQGGLARVKRYGNPGTPEGRSLGGKNSLKTHERGTGFNILKKIPPLRASVELAELLGILAGDGHIGEYQVSVTTNAETDIDHARYTVSLMERVLGLAPTLARRKGQNAVVITLSSKDAGRRLIRRGAIKGDKIRGGIMMPAWIRTRIVFHKAFLRGLFDTDGSVYIDHHIIRGRSYENIGMVFTNYSRPLLDDFKKGLEALGLHPTQNTEHAVFLRREKEIERYFLTIGSSNPKFILKISEFFSRKRRGRIVV